MCQGCLVGWGRHLAEVPGLWTCPARALSYRVAAGGLHASCGLERPNCTLLTLVAPAVPSASPGMGAEPGTLCCAGGQASEPHPLLPVRFCLCWLRWSCLALDEAQRGCRNRNPSWSEQQGCQGCAPAPEAPQPAAAAQADGHSQRCATLRVPAQHSSQPIRICKHTRASKT